MLALQGVLKGEGFWLTCWRPGELVGWGVREREEGILGAKEGELWESIGNCEGEPIWG